MSKQSIIANVKNGFNNKNIKFIVFRYFIYAVQFGNSLLIAKNLGPYFMGELGFMMLIIQYITQVNLGIPNALNVKLSTYEGKSYEKQSEFLSNSILFISLHSIIIVAAVASTYFFEIPIFNKYDFYSYIILVVSNAIVQNFDLLFIHAFRVKNALKPITLYQSIIPLLNFISCIFWKGQQLLYAILISQLFSYALCFIIFFFHSPIKLNFKPQLNVLKELLKTGSALMLYSASFYFIMIVSRTFISYYYSVKELGYFSFALSFAQASFLALDTITFLIMPKLINRFKHAQSGETFKKMAYVKDNYTLISYLLIFLTILVFPAILFFVPGYNDSFKPFALLSLCEALLSGNFGISVLFISHGKEGLLGKVALFSFLLNLLLVWIISYNSSVFYFVCFAPIFTYTVYTALLGYCYNVIFLSNKSAKGLFSNFDIRLVLPALMLSIAVAAESISLQVISYVLVVIFNWNRMKGLYSIIGRFINNPSVFKI